MQLTRWTNVSVVKPAGTLDTDLLVAGDVFAGTVPRGTPMGEDWLRMDGGGAILFPGMLDLLQHGFGPHLYHEVEPGAVAASAGRLLAHGVTGFLPSIGCLPPAELAPVLSALAAQARAATGARVLGLHSEGPCFGWPGAHNPQNVQAPSRELAQAMLDAADGTLRAVTVAPERDGAEAFVRTLAQAGVSVHLGHSRARPEDVPRYVAWGINAVTHMYDVMPTLPPDGSGVHVPSLTDALLAEPGLALGLIADGIHAHPMLVRLLAQLPADRVFLETDAMRFAGTPGGTFEFYPGYAVRSVPGGAVRDAAGGLCGSSLTPDEALRNWLRFTGGDLARAAHATSLVPARVLGLEHSMGAIARGRLADFVVLDRDTLAVRATHVGGVERYRAA